MPCTVAPARCWNAGDDGHMPHHTDNAGAFSELLLIRGGYSSAVAALRYRPLNSQQAACTTVEPHIPGNRPAKLLCLRRLQIFWTFAKNKAAALCG